MKLSTTSISTLLNENKIYRNLFWVLFSLALIFLFFDTADNGHDFVVMYRAASSYLHHEPIYSIERDGGMVFKYPPWWIFCFIPYALFPLSVAKALWAATNVGSLVSIFFSLMRLGFSFFSVSVSVMAFWGIWAVHFIDGQVEVLVLALVLFLLEKLNNNKLPKYAAGIVYLMSIKGPSILGAFGVFTKKNILKVGSIFFIVISTVTLIASLTTTHGMNIMSDWKDAASSGSQALEPGKAVLGRDNQGIPAMVHRVNGSFSAHALPELGVNGIVFVLGAVVALYLFSGLSLIPRTFFWLAAGVVLHPLAWFHLFVWCLPLTVYVVDRAGKREVNEIWFWFPLLLGAVTARTLGSFGQSLEFYSFKSLVVCTGLVWFSIKSSALTQSNPRHI
ncbi:MAG: DUF2029 domain-containing protein [Xanthomonadaceae bacterium]|nr:DUF2029 domain-containing protein [Xanthomonadaceae bacterium]